MTLLMALALLPSPSASAPAAAPSPSVPAGAAVIENSGSTNFTGYRVVVMPDGAATVVLGSRAPATGHVSAAQAGKFFADLKAAGPLDSLELEHCAKSVSFGTSTFVTWNGKRSADISCGGGPSATALLSDAQAIVVELHVQAMPRHPVPQPS